MNDSVEPTWDYLAYPSDTPAEQFGPFQAFVEIWYGKMPQPGRLPGRPDFDFFDFTGWHGLISIVEVHHDPFDLYFTLWGTELVDWWDHDPTKTFASANIGFGEVWSTVECAFYRRLVDAKAIGFATGSLLDVGRQSFVRMIDLPLQQDGKISHIISAYQKFAPSEEFIPAVTSLFTMRE